MTNQSGLWRYVQKTVNIHYLGSFIDGWADLIENVGFKELDAQLEVRKLLVAKQTLGMYVSATEFRKGLFQKEKRIGITSQTSPGVTTIIYLANHGKDLYASWRSFIRPSVNWELIGCYFIAALVFSIVLGIIRFFSDVYKVTQGVLSVLNWQTMLAWLLVAAGILFAEFIIWKIFTLANKRKFTFWTFLIMMVIGLLLGRWIRNSDASLVYQLSQAGEVISQAFKFYSPPLITIMWVPISMLFGIILLILPAGLILRGNIFAFILNIPDLFDIDNITAMNLTVHKSILRALDNVGIQTANLRLKQEFKAGRRGGIV